MVKNSPELACAIARPRRPWRALAPRARDPSRREPSTRPTYTRRVRVRPSSAISWAAMAWSSARSQRPASHSSMLRPQRHAHACPRRPAQPPPLSISSSTARATRSLPGAYGAGRARGAGCRRNSSDEPEALLDLGAALEQAGSDLGRPCLGMPDAARSQRRSGRVADTFGLLERRPRVRERRRDRRPASNRTWLRQARMRGDAHVVAAASASAWSQNPTVSRWTSALNVVSERKEDVCALDAGRNHVEQPLEHRGRQVDVAGEAVEGRSLQAAPARPEESAGVRSAASSESSAAAPGAPRAAACSAAASSSEAIPRPVLRRRARGDGRSSTS